jgi:hypothetical protein
MGNTPSSSSSKSRRGRLSPETAAERAKKVVVDIQEEFKKSVKKLDDDHPAAQLIDSICGGYVDDKYRVNGSFYSQDDGSEDGSRTISDEGTYDPDDSTRRDRKDASTVESSSYMSQSDYESEPKNNRRGGRRGTSSFDTEDDSKIAAAASIEELPPVLSKPLASSFAKRCYFTKSGIGKTTQHYEGLTLTGNIVLMLAAAMKLKGCPTICDEDLRRVEQTYPNQFSRLPDELLLSSGWRRISKYCHFSNKPIPDGIPFFRKCREKESCGILCMLFCLGVWTRPLTKFVFIFLFFIDSMQRLHPSGGYYFLLAAAVGMVRPIDVEPLSKDTLVLLETDFPSQCDMTPDILIQDADQWTLVDKFCFFSGGPINTEEDVYYQADFDGNPIFMLAFLSPSLTPEELYKLGEKGEPGLKSCGAVQEVESVYDLTVRDFDDLKLYHLGPCRALPQYILLPQAWMKVLPPHFLAARQTAMLRAQDFEVRRAGLPQSQLSPLEGGNGNGTEYFDNEQWPPPVQRQPRRPLSEQHGGGHPMDDDGQFEPHASPSRYHENDPTQTEFQREVDEEGAFSTAP